MHEWVQFLVRSALLLSLVVACAEAACGINAAAEPDAIVTAGQLVTKSFSIQGAPDEPQNFCFAAVRITSAAAMDIFPQTALRGLGMSASFTATLAGKYSINVDALECGQIFMQLRSSHQESFTGITTPSRSNVIEYVANQFTSANIYVTWIGWIRFQSISSFIEITAYSRSGKAFVSFDGVPVIDCVTRLCVDASQQRISYPCVYGKSIRLQVGFQVDSANFDSAYFNLSWSSVDTVGGIFSYSSICVSSTEPSKMLWSFIVQSSTANAANSYVEALSATTALVGSEIIVRYNLRDAYSNAVEVDNAENTLVAWLQYVGSSGQDGRKTVQLGGKLSTLVAPTYLGTVSCRVCLTGSNGLHATYYSQKAPVTPIAAGIQSSIDFSRGSNQLAPFASCPFSARWQGFIRASASSVHTFILSTQATASNSQLQLNIDGLLRLDSWTTFPALSSVSGTVGLIQNNLYSVYLQYECFASTAATDFDAKLVWVYANLNEVVPSSNLIPSWDFSNAGSTSNTFQVLLQSRFVCSTTSVCFGSGLTIATSGSKLQFSVNALDEYGQISSNNIEWARGSAKSASGVIYPLDVILASNLWTFSWIPIISGQYNVALTANSTLLCGPNAALLLVQPGIISSGTSAATIVASVINAGNYIEFQIITRDGYGNQAITPDCSNLMNIGLVASQSGILDGAYASSSLISQIDSSKVTLKSSLFSASGTYNIDVVIMSSIVGSFGISVLPSSRLVLTAIGSVPTSGVIGENITFYYTNCLDEFGNSVSDALIFANANAIIGSTTVYPTMVQPNCRKAASAQATFRFNAIGTYSIFAQSAIGKGFAATYYSSASLTSAVTSKTSLKPSISRAASETEYPLSQTDTNDGYSVRWKGFLRKYIAGFFTIVIQVANGNSEKIRLLIDKVQILNNDADSTKIETYSATINFGDSTSYHEISLEYMRGATVSGVDHSSFLAFGLIDSVSNSVGIQSSEWYDVRYADDLQSLGVVQSIVISSSGSTPTGLSDFVTNPVSVANVPLFSTIEFTITPRDSFNSALTTCVSAVVLMRPRSILEFVNIAQIDDQSVKKCKGSFSSLTTSGTYQLQIFATNNYAGATYYQDAFFQIPVKTSIIAAPSLKWDDVPNPSVPVPISFKMTWMAQINSSCVINIQCSSLISMNLNSQSIVPTAGQNLGKSAQIVRQYSWRPSFEDNRNAYFELWGIIEPGDSGVSVQKLCYRNQGYSWGALQNLVLISTLTMVVIPDVTSAMNCEIRALNDGLNLIVPVNIAIMKISCLKDQYGNIQTQRNLNIATHFKKINSAGTQFGDGNSAILQSFSQNEWLVSFLSSKSGTFGITSGVVGVGSLAATFYDTAKKLNQQGALMAAFWNVNSLSASYNLVAVATSLVMSFGGFVSMPANVNRIFQVSVADAGSATFTLWVDGTLSTSGTLLAGNSATGLFAATNFNRITTITGDTLIPIQLICSTTTAATTITLLWYVGGSFQQIPTTNMYSLTYNIQPPNLLQSFEVKASNSVFAPDFQMTFSAAGTGLSVMTVGVLATFSVFCKDSSGTALDASLFASQIRCSLMNLLPSFSEAYATPCVMKSSGSNIIVSVTPSSMQQKLMLIVYGGQGFWATYYSSTDWTNPVASRIEASIDYSHLAASGPVTTLTAGYSVRWRGFCLMPSPGPLTMSFSKTAGDYSLITDTRALSNSEVSAVQMELKYTLNPISSNIVKLEWVSSTTSTNMIVSFLKLVLEYGGLQQILIVPGLCSLKTSSFTGGAIATVGFSQSLTLTLVDLFQNACSLSNLAIAAYAIGRTFQVPLFAKLPTLNVAWKKEGLYSVNVMLGLSRSGPGITAFQDSACSMQMYQGTLQTVDLDPTIQNFGLAKVARCIAIEGLLELSAAASYSVVSQVDTSYPPNGMELPCMVNLTVWGVGSNITRDDDPSKSVILSSVNITAYMPGFVYFSLIYKHAQNCNRIRMMLTTFLDDPSMYRSVSVDSSNAGVILESNAKAMRIRVVANSIVSAVKIEATILPKGSYQVASYSSVEFFTLSCRDDNNFGSLCKADEMYASTCSVSKGKRCNQPIGMNFESLQSATFKSVITVASAYKQSVVITTGMGLWATYYDNSFPNSPFVSFVEQSISSSAFKIDSNSYLYPISSGFSARWVGFIRSDSLSTTITSLSIPQSDTLTVSVDNSIVFDQQFTSGSQSGTISLQSNILYDIEVEYRHVGTGQVNMELTFSPPVLFYFAYQKNSTDYFVNVNAATSTTCQLDATSTLVTVVTLGIPISFSLSCTDQFQNSISKANDISVAVVISGDSSIPVYSQNSTFANGLIVISSVLYCCVSTFTFQIGVDSANYNSPPFISLTPLPAEANTIVNGPAILTSGLAAVFTVYARDSFNRSAVFGNSSVKLYLSHITIAFPNFTRLDKTWYSISSTYSNLVDSQMLTNNRLWYN